MVTVLAGDRAEAVGLAERFREGWERAGRPRAGNLSRGAYAAAKVHGLRGDDGARAASLDIVGALRDTGPPARGDSCRRVLRRPAPAAPRAVRTGDARAGEPPPEQFNEWYSGMWRPWYAALWVEAAVLSGHSDAAARVDRAGRMTTGNPLATAIVELAAVLARGDGDRDGLTAVAAALEDAGCRYSGPARSSPWAGSNEPAASPCLP